MQQTKQELIEELKELLVDLEDCQSRIMSVTARVGNEDVTFRAYVNEHVDVAVKRLAIFIYQVEQNATTIAFKYECHVCFQRYDSLDSADKCALSHRE